MVDDFKVSVGWDEKHFVGIHIRRTDLAITQPDVSLILHSSHFDPCQPAHSLWNVT